MNQPAHLPLPADHFLRLQPDGTYQVVFDGVPVPGMTISPDDLATGAEDREHFGYLETVRKGKKRIRLNLAAYRRSAHLAASRPNPPRRVVDFFCGAGLAFAWVKEEIKPVESHVWDFDPFCLRHLQRNYPEGVSIHSANSLLPGEGAEHVDESTFILFDSNNFTALDVVRNRDKGAALARALARGPRAVAVSDCTYWKLHVNYGPYSKALGAPIKDRTSYLNVWSRYLYDRFGYSITEAWGYSASAVTLIEPGPPRPLTWRESAELVPAVVEAAPRGRKASREGDPSMVFGEGGLITL